MPKFFQNKFLLKSVQVFLVCLIVLGGVGNSNEIRSAGRECGSEVILVLDESESMRNSMVDVKNAANSFIDDLMADPAIKNRAGVVWYENSAKLWQSLTDDKGAIKSAIDKGSARGLTNMADGINEAVDDLNDHGDTGVPKVIVHLTDGKPTEGGAVTAFDDAKNAGIKVINIGLGYGADDVFLKDNASDDCPTSHFPDACYWEATTGDLEEVYAAIAAIMGDHDGDGYRSVECGGDDCDDSKDFIYPEQPCFNKCFNNVLKGGTCEAGTGECVYDSVVMSCEKMGDPCKLDGCTEISGGDDVCVADTGPNLCGGLIPCGRMVDDCDTAWDERADCNLCHLIIMGKLIIDFLLEMAVVVGALFVTLGGILYIFATGDTGKMALAKRTISLTLLGFAIIFVSWIMVNTVAVVFGYVDPLDSGGKWHKMNCEVPMRTCSSSPPAATFCGDGVVQKPNSAGFNEECDTDGSSCGSLVCNADCTCKTEPTPGVCGVWFSDAVQGTVTCEVPFTAGSTNANWVANGSYPNNAIAFPNAAGAGKTFDGIAIDENTHLELWDGPNYTGTKVVDITGPVVINNGPFTSSDPGLCDGGGLATCWGLKSIPAFAAWSCQKSSENMSSWNNGSCKITCTAP